MVKPKRSFKGKLDDNESNDVSVSRLRVTAALKQLGVLQSIVSAGAFQTFDESDISVRLDLIEKLERDFDKFQSVIEDDNPHEIEGDARSSFMSIYMTVKAAFTRELNSRRDSNNPHSSTARGLSSDNMLHSLVYQQPKTRLPTLQIPTFYGKHIDWPDFYQTFQSFVDKNVDLSNVEKFQHLRSSLKGAALDTIKSLEISEDNYSKALNLLKKRFDNKRLNFQGHIKELFALQAVGNDSSLRQLSDKAKSHLRALESMATREQLADGLLVHLIGKKMDIAAQTKWEEETPIDMVPPWNAMEDFLERRCQMLENVENAMANQTPSKQVGKSIYNSNIRKKAFVASAPVAKVCTFCQSSGHLIYHCSQFNNFTPEIRFKEAKRLHLCINCLKSGHGPKTCRSTHCRTCSAKHHTMLHMASTNNDKASQLFTTPNSTAASSNVEDTAIPSSSYVTSLVNNNSLKDAPSSHSALCSISPSDSQSCVSTPLNTNVLLATAIVYVKNICGSLVPCRAILDSASQLNFISVKLANQLQLKKRKSTTIVSGIGESDFIADASVNLFMQSLTGNFSATISAIVSPTITDQQPNFQLNTKGWVIPKNIKLADPNFFKSQRIDLLIGAELFFDLMCVGQIRLGPNLPLLQKTKLGWIVCGSVHTTTSSSTCLSTSLKIQCHDPDYELESLVRKFWEVDTLSEPINKLTKEEQLCENHFVEHHTRLANGAYSVHLPTKLDPTHLGFSYKSALNRFMTLERRFQANNKLKSQYSAFMNEYLQLGHMSLVQEPLPKVPIYFLPHHCVYKSDSTTTKLRVVFDGSAASSNGISLNDVLMAGPTIQPKLCDILLRFRTFKIALTADICKMYRCVKVASPDNFLQCILWRENSQDPIKIFKLDTVTYGTKSAAFLAVRAMHQLALDEERIFPVGSKIIRRDFYVDDMISGGNSVNEVLRIMHETKELLNKGDFSLRKWCSNNQDIMNEIDDAHKEEYLAFHDGTNVTKTLGLVWNPKTDVFLFAFFELQNQSKVTKRSILSTIARFYDPLGLIGPIITKAKIFHQLLWKMKCDWDESLPQSLHSEWACFCREFKFVDTITFNRVVLVPHAKLQIHAFCDASLCAYGACIYVRSNDQGNITTALLCSKSRVSPLQTLTIPRLELQAAYLLATFLNSVVNLKLFEAELHCWCDSTIVLSWLRDEPSRYNVFVSNRISNIQTLTKGMEWHYVPSKMNPADILSKGATPNALKDLDLWFHGPSFLKEDPLYWPSLPDAIIQLPERRAIACISSSKLTDFSQNCKFTNSFLKMQKVFAYISRFGSKGQRAIGPLTTQDIQAGTRLLLRMVQRVALPEEYKLLESKKTVKSSSSLYSLNPFLDNFGLIRVGGRLQHSFLEFASRHPIILPKGHPISDSLIMHHHQKFLHAGSQALLASIRLQYWPIGGRKYVNSIVNKCVRCFHVKPRILEHIMGSLPEDRVQASRAFMTTGVDFCGPFLHKSDVRGRSPMKCYICLFICFATKAVHMELVKDLTTPSFLASLQRFICTRGSPKTIWSDNATNFIGAKNELAELKRLFSNDSHIKAIEDQCLADGINWKFIPPRSPHFGGLWEAAIKTAKYHFYRAVGSSILTYDELRTLVCQISAIINSRPLCPLSESPEDLEVLTPAHFLIGASFSSFAEPDVTDLTLNRVSRWQRICCIHQIFWKKWSTEYLTLLQERSKWRSNSPNLKIGSMVLIKDDNLPPLKWKMGRIINTTLGDDGVARIATIRTCNGLTTRAIRKLCVLPIEAVESVSLPTGGVCPSPDVR